MAKASWTYEVPSAGADSVGLEEYVVEEVSGEPVGKVLAVLERHGELYVAVERGTPPLTHDVRAIPWDDIREVDHSDLTVHIARSREALEEALELDPQKRVEGERAEAVRLMELPAEVRPAAAAPETPGPVDRSALVQPMAWFALTLLALLAIFVAALAVEFTWHFVLFAVPGLFLVLAAVTGYRFFRRPYEHGGRRER